MRKKWIIYFTDGSTTDISGIDLTKEEAIASCGRHKMYRNYTVVSAELVE
jgi:hypothetical protein